MKNKVFIVLCSIFLISCATTPRTSSQVGQFELVNTSSDESLDEEVVKNLVVWHLVTPLSLEVKLLNLDHKSKNVSLQLDTTLSPVKLPVGHWKIIAFTHRGVEYKTRAISESFVFNVKNNTNTYAGSILIQCPKVGKQSYKDLKKMSFYNRYLFGSDREDNCEMIVGSQFRAVKRAFRAVNRSKLPLIQGF